MLNACVMVVVDVFLDLRFLFTSCWLVNWHLDILVVVRNDNRSQSRVLCVHHLVINGPESVETQTFFVPADCWFHLQIWLIAHNVVHSFESDWFQNIIETFLVVMWHKTWHEQTLVVFTFNKGMSSLAVSSD